MKDRFRPIIKRYRKTFFKKLCMLERIRSVLRLTLNHFLLSVFFRFFSFWLVFPFLSRYVMESLNLFVGDINSVLWGVCVLIPLLCGTGIFYTI